MAKALVTAVDGRNSIGNVTLRKLEVSQRAFRAGKWLGIFWGISVVCILVPMLHFVLVPSFFIIGITAFLKVFRQQELVEILTAACPACGALIEFKNFPSSKHLKEVCPACRFALKIQITE